MRLSKLRNSVSFPNIGAFALGLALAAVVGEIGLECLALRTFPRSWRELSDSDVKEERERLKVRVDDRSLPEIVRALRATALISPWRQWLRFRDQQASPLRANGVALAGVSDSPTVYCNETGEYLAYQSDERGFHNPEGAHRKGADLVLIGDGFVHGACVRPGQTLGARLRHKIPRTVSLGMGGSGPLSELGILAEYAAPLRPEKVVWFFYEGDDFQDLLEEGSVPELLAYLKPGYSQKLILRTAEVDAVQREATSQILELPRLSPPAPSLARLLHFEALRAAWRRYGKGQGTATTEAQWLLLGQVFAAAKIRVASWGGELRVVLLPSRLSVGEPRMFREERRRLSHALESLGIPYRDLLPAFLRQEDPTALFPFRGHFHYNGDGYALVADAVGKWLEEPIVRHASLP